MLSKLLMKYKVWKLGRQKADSKKLSDGSVVIKTGDGVYFLAVDEDGVPILIDKAEGERLWNL